MARQTSGAMICPNCNKLISVSEERCPFCGAWRPAMFGMTPALRKLFGGNFDFPHLVTIACVALYVLSLALDPQALLHPPGLFAILSPSIDALDWLGMTYGAALGAGRWWTVLTAIYLHGGLLHIFFNLMSVRNLGPSVVSVFGSARCFVIFTVAGAVGFLLSDFATGSPSIGASGGIFGLLAALIVYGRRSGHSALTMQLYQSAIIMFVMGFLIPHVNNWAHAGGFAAGWVTAEAMRFHDEGRESVAVQVVALVTLVATLGAFALSFIRVALVLMRG